jgi:hypothetical protein
VKKIKLILGIAILSSLILLGCQKKLFWHVEMHGRVLNFVTKAPEQAEITLYSNGRPGHGGSINVGSTTTNVNGTFDLKTPSYRYKYYLDVAGTPSGVDNNPIEIEPILKDGHNVDVGDFYIGYFTYFCKVTLVPVSTSAIDFKPGMGMTTIHFNSGTSTQFMSHEKRAYDYNPDNYQICFTTYPGGIPKDSCITIPTHLKPDTLSLTIQY